MHIGLIFWKRVILAGFASELGVVVALSVVILSYRFVIRPGQSTAVYQEFGHLAGYYLATPLAAVSTFVVAFWMSRGLESAIYPETSSPRHLKLQLYSRVHVRG